MINLLSVKDLDVNYGQKQILKKLNIDIPKGSIYALVGPSGCGKSTLLKALAAIKSHKATSITLNESKLSPKTHTIGYIPQDFGLLKWKNVYDNIIMGAIIKAVDYKASIDDIISELSLGNLLSAYPNELSGGEKQRVAIARSLLIKADILLMDEPFSSLDTYSKDNAINLFLTVWKNHKVTTLIVTHDHTSAMYLGQKIIIMDAKGNIADVKDNKLFGQEHTNNLGLYKEMIDELKAPRKGV